MTPRVLTVMLIAAGADWVSRGEHQGVQLESREVAGSSFEEVRSTIVTPVEPTRICAAIWGSGVKAEKGFKSRTTLREDATDRWSYERVEVPLISDRDYTIHLHRETFEDGTCRVEMTMDNDAGPPERPGLVRMAAVQGSWLVTVTDAGTKVVYTLYSDPGGFVPGFLARGSQRTKTAESMLQILSRAQRDGGTL